ncbi:response regulator [bacterium]|nr:response regulator [bacterium]
MKKVLVVDDVKAIRNLIVATLSKSGIQMLEADNGRDAVTIAKREIPDVIIMDVMMPGLNGIQATTQIKADPLTKNCVVIMLTAKLTGEDKKAGFSAGASEFLTKPFGPKELMDKLDKYLSL